MNGGSFQSNFKQFIDLIARKGSMTFFDALVRDVNQVEVELFLKLSQDILVGFVGNLDKLIEPETVAV